MQSGFTGIADGAVQKCLKNGANRSANLSAEELFHLGEDCFNGADGKPKDYAKSVYYYQKSADKGNMYAINDLGYFTNLIAIRPRMMFS